MDLLLIKMEKVEECFWNNLLQFISENGYKPQIVSRCREELSFKEIQFIPLKRQKLFRHQQVFLTPKEQDRVIF